MGNTYVSTVRNEHFILRDVNLYATRIFRLVKYLFRIIKRRQFCFKSPITLCRVYVVYTHARARAPLSGFIHTRCCIHIYLKICSRTGFISRYMCILKVCGLLRYCVWRSYRGRNIIYENNAQIGDAITCTLDESVIPITLHQLQFLSRNHRFNNCTTVSVISAISVHVCIEVPSRTESCDWHRTFRIRRENCPRRSSAGCSVHYSSLMTVGLSLAGRRYCYLIGAYKLFESIWAKAWTTAALRTFMKTINCAHYSILLSVFIRTNKFFFYFLF